jgi:hypothetical protein
MECEIEWFTERDIDLLIAEELKANGDFATRVLQKLGITNCLVPAKHVRVSKLDDACRETDVEALFEKHDGSKVALLIENKIRAAFQPLQMADYLRRGEKGIAGGKWKEFVAIDLVNYLIALAQRIGTKRRLVGGGCGRRTSFGRRGLAAERIEADQPGAKPEEEVRCCAGIGNLDPVLFEIRRPERHESRAPQAVGFGRIEGRVRSELGVKQHVSVLRESLEFLATPPGPIGRLGEHAARGFDARLVPGGRPDEPRMPGVGDLADRPGAPVRQGVDR